MFYKCTKSVQKLNKKMTGFSFFHKWELDGNINLGFYAFSLLAMSLNFPKGKFNFTVFYLKLKISIENFRIPFTM